MKKCSKGSNLVQYGIPTLLVGLVFGMGLYYFVSSGQLLNFYAKSADMKRNSNDPQVGILNARNVATFKAGDLGGIPSKPVVKCENNKCVIDYGSYILKGVPENFEVFVESSANSGGSDEIALLFMQLADQLEEKGDTTGAQEFRDLANLGHFIANIERTIEQKAKACQSSDGSIAGSCFHEGLNNTNIGLEVPESIKQYLTNFDPNTKLLDVKETTRVGYARSVLNSDPTDYNNNLKSNPSYAFLSVFDRIVNDNTNKYPPELKGITKTLAQYLEELSYHHAFIANDLYYVEFGATKYTKDETDIITGQSVSSNDESRYGGLHEILKPQFSFRSDLDSALICASGNNNDTGLHCLGGS